jgi:CRP-like cAMP-binding protein
LQAKLEKMKESELHFAPMWDLNPLWNTLTEGEKEQLAKDVELVHYAKNEIIHHDGDESEYVWMLLHGKVRIYKEGIGQRQQIIRLLKPYDIFGYRACTVNEPYNSSASAFEACTVYRLEREKFNKLIQGNGALCYQVMLMMAKDLAFSEIQTVNLTQKHIRGRLAESITMLIDKYGYEADGMTINAALPREDLAALSNMTTSNAIRTLGSLVADGILEVEGRRIRLLNPEKLRHSNANG